VAHQLTRDLPPEQTKTLDALLTTKEGTGMSKLAWARVSRQALPVTAPLRVR
jgi:hypothetical protein